jgi:hypothetical protein
MRPSIGTPGGAAVGRRRSTIVLALTLAIVSVFTLAAPASAASNKHRLRFQNCYLQDGSWAWETTVDSPLDANDRALHVVVPTDGCVLAFTNASQRITKLASKVKNVSFDFAEPPGGTVTGGSPRFSILLTNDHFLFVDANNCRGTIDATWGRADFTGFLSTDVVCSIFLDDGTQYTNTPTQTAWQVFAAANPAVRVVSDFFITDIPGDYTVDRISFGSNKLYGNGNNPSANCGLEANC